MAMTSLPAWQTKQFLQSKTAKQHMAETEVDLLRPHVLAAVANDAAYQDSGLGERFLHAYLNECRSGREKEWYEAMQKGFTSNHLGWAELFGGVLETRRMQGSKAQKVNIMGDWLALSQLQGRPLAFDMLSQPKRQRHPPAPVLSTDDIMITVAAPKEGLYKHAFELLYTKHQSEHNGWQALLRRMSLRGMTPAIWDKYVDLYPTEVDVPLKGMTLRGYEWQGVLAEFIAARHALTLNRVLVNFMQTGRADEMYSQLSEDSYIRPDGPLYNKHMSEALYETLKTYPDVRQKFITQHLVHVVNTEPRRIVAELNYAVGEKPNAHASRDLVKPLYLAQLQPAARDALMNTLGQNPEKYSSILELLLKDASENVTKQEMPALLRTSYAKALLVQGLIKGNFSSFATQIANSSDDIKEQLFATDFEIPHAFERVMMQYLTPQLSYEDAIKLLSIASSLGADDNMAREMIQTAFDGSSAQNSLPIDGLVDDTPESSAFPT